MCQVLLKAGFANNTLEELIGEIKSKFVELPNVIDFVKFDHFNPTFLSESCRYLAKYRFFVSNEDVLYIYKVHNRHSLPIEDQRVFSCPLGMLAYGAEQGARGKIVMKLA